MRGGPRVVSPAVDWHESKCISRTGSTRPNSLPPPRLREASTGCLRLTSRSLARKGASTGVVFCSGRTLPVMAACRPSSKEVAEADRPICCAAQTVHVTVSATAHPVHLLVRSWVALGFANCTEGASACPMPRVYGPNSAGFASGKRELQGNVTQPPCTVTIQHGSF